MFSSNKNNTSDKNNTQNKSASNFNYLVEGSIFEGKVVSKNDFRIDGYFKGTLACTSKIVIGTSGEFIGDISCDNAVVEGKFSGVLKVKSLLVVKEKASIDGEIVTGKLMVQEGARFHVTCAMDSNTDPTTVLTKSDDV